MRKKEDIGNRPKEQTGGVKTTPNKNNKKIS